MTTEKELTQRGPLAMHMLDELAPWDSVTRPELVPVESGLYKDDDGGPWTVTATKRNQVSLLTRQDTGELWTCSQAFARFHYDSDLHVAQVALLCSIDSGLSAVLLPRDLRALSELLQTESRTGIELKAQTRATSPGAVGGCQPLDDVRDFLMRFLVLPGEHAYEVMTVWIAHTYSMECHDTTPRLTFMSPQPGSGKTLALDLIDLLANNPLLAVDMSASSLYRSINAKNGQLTLLLDEIDTIFQVNNSAAEAIRAILNAGYKRGNSVTRSGSGKQGYRTEKFSIFGPAALAGLGVLPTSLRSRSIVINMQKPLPAERRERFRRSRVESEARVLAAGLRRWAEVMDGLEPPDLPDILDGRAAEVWEPLITLADMAGEAWSEAIRTAAVTSVTSVTSSHGVETADNQLLRGIREVFSQRSDPKITSAQLVGELCSREELDLDSLTTREVATRLKPYGIQPKVIRIGSSTSRGYERVMFEDTWSRYLSEA